MIVNGLNESILYHLFRAQCVNARGNILIKLTQEELAV